MSDLYPPPEGNEADRERCMTAGASDYLSKPVKLADLRAMIERWTSSES